MPQAEPPKPSRDGLCLSFIGNVSVCPFSLSRSPRCSRFVSLALSSFSHIIALLVFRALSLCRLLSLLALVEGARRRVVRHADRTLGGVRKGGADAEAAVAAGGGVEKRGPRCVRAARRPASTDLPPRSVTAGRARRRPIPTRTGRRRSALPPFRSSVTPLLPARRRNPLDHPAGSRGGRDLRRPSPPSDWSTAQRPPPR